MMNRIHGQIYEIGYCGLEYGFLDKCAMEKFCQVYSA